MPCSLVGPRERPLSCASEFAYTSYANSLGARSSIRSLPLGRTLPVVPLWLGLDLCVPLRLEESYLAACHSLRIPA